MTQDVTDLEAALAEAHQAIAILWEDSQDTPTLSWTRLAADFPQIVHDTVEGARQVEHGDPVQMLSMVAHLWQPLFGPNVTAETVAVALIQLKVARLIQGGTPDSALDIAGYASLLAKVGAAREAQPSQ